MICTDLQLFVRAFGKDGSSKSILVDEKMSISDVCNVLADKNHTRLNSKLAVVEHMPELLMGTSASSKLSVYYFVAQTILIIIQKGIL